MSHKITRYSFVSIAAISLATYIFFATHTTSKTSRKHIGYDAFVTQLNQIEYNKTGAINTTFLSPNIKHYSKDGHAFITKPHIVLHNTRGIWDVTADNATTANNNNTIYLNGHVKIIQPKTANAPKTVITTNTATVYPHQSYATTKDEVTITRAGTVIHGQGATADMKNGIIKLLAHTRGSYVPQSNP